METVKYRRLAVHIAKFKLYFIHGSPVNEPGPFVVSPSHLTAT